MSEQPVEGAGGIATFGRWAGLATAIAFIVSPSFGWQLHPVDPKLNYMAGIAALMAIWWLTEALPMAATALVPLALMPLFGIASMADVSASYGSRFIYLFLGGFLIALAVEESGLHRRLALSIVYAMGDKPRRIVLGFMIATAALSMWISNTATALLMLPIAASILTRVDAGKMSLERRVNLGAALMLGIAYAASIGGVATIVGTPPNVAFASFYATEYPNGEPVSFLSWMLVATPFSIAFLAIGWWMMTYWIFPCGSEASIGGRSVIREELDKLGAMVAAEWRVGAIFLITALLWIMREPVKGWGWGPLLQNKFVDDGTAAIFMALFCFLLPSGKEDGSRLLNWKSTARIPWGVLLLFGGGVALAGGLEDTGLDRYLGDFLATTMRGLPPVVMAALTANGMIWLTELTSNLASVQMLNPILASTADELQVSPLLLLIPSTLAASCAFMMPVATPPNAIVYSSGRVTMRQMVKAGFLLNLVSLALIILVISTIGPLIFESLTM
ncbi:DASS family sodium-coupled anion symporter [Blastopirellula sp. JC732]|uniref:DASS family sodium-coupled anion symporter n=1 Tax=Blastopirellula sediminis TaxID=2894196 RepID=A0A9X1MLM0_9BACT|nr:DASS family sodium-coupled anion symporter [Blastopirellula sediminis]MCC9608703.1 DASS family sodium-coupled anion symporter [Blastopirellula sediminis]MCC9628520.1 DASS family sodium-coupled anion symporter [Blastopirellula sediminis]